MIKGLLLRILRITKPMKTTQQSIHEEKKTLAVKMSIFCTVHQFLLAG